MRTFTRPGKKQVVDGNTVTTSPAEWQPGDPTTINDNPIVHVEQVEDAEEYIAFLLANGYVEELAE